MSECVLRAEFRTARVMRLVYNEAALKAIERRVLATNGRFPFRGLPTSREQRERNLIRARLHQAWNARRGIYLLRVSKPFATRLVAYFEALALAGDRTAFVDRVVIATRALRRFVAASVVELLGQLDAG